MLRSSLDDSKCTSQFSSFITHSFARMVRSHSVLGLGTRLNFSAIASENWCVPLSLQSPLPFPSPFELWCGEPSEKVPGSSVPMLLQMDIGLLWSNGCQSSTLRVLYFGMFLSFPFTFHLIGAPSSGLSLVSISRFEVRTFDFLLEIRLWNNHTSCRKVSPLERRLATSISFLPDLHLVQTLQKAVRMLKHLRAWCRYTR